MKIMGIINKQANAANLLKLEDILAAAAEFNLNFQGKFLDPDAIENALQEAIVEKADVVLIGGGDGSIRTAAEILLNTEIALAILPIGTYNHFATALELPTDIREIFKLIREEKIKRVDVAEVNGNIFLNNASIGFYAKILKQREKYVDIFSKNKLWKIALNIFNIFNRFPVYNIGMEINGKKTFYSSSLIFIGNNYYDLTENSGNREKLDAGRLCVYVLKAKNKWGMFKMLLALLFRKSSLDNYLDLHITQTLSITSRHRKIDIALDGELKLLDSPLVFTIRQKSLKVYSGETNEIHNPHI